MSEDHSYSKLENAQYDQHRNPDEAYLTFTIPQCQRVRHITFDISSHDQGWSNYRHQWGTYEDSHTWFEVGVVPTEGGNGSPADATRHVIQRNVHARRQTTNHIVSWDDETASTEVSEWMKALKPGTTVGVFARALYPGWVNHVERVAVRLETLV
ncbi:hypothetical protein C8034_v007957 [Colletotrichum sidae]|uniref:Uncharacterized protein n=1 Tax=Colletotrichum sidae TaxID=1347389 RepID=A0A4R8T2J0_9PEZI|nr:hypothetical protein C8034_v007957 [Colletotrichum sidae]